MKIRKAKTSDLDKIIELNKNLFLYERKFDDSYNTGWSESEVGRSYFDRRIREQNGLVLVAEVSGKVIGYLACFIGNYIHRSVNPIAEIENMYVEEKHRGKGIGKMLVKELTKILKERKVKRLKVESLWPNKDATGFYKSLGIKEHAIVLEKDL